MSNAIKGYTVVAYPESMPKDYVNLLDVLPFGYCYSLHDKDVDDDGVIKKAHIHFFFYGCPSAKQKEYIHTSLGVYYGECVRNSSAMYDYLTHNNHPNKYHYSVDNIIKSSKWNQDLFDCSYVPKHNYSADIIEIIKHYGIIEYSDLMPLVIASGDDALISESQKYWVTRYLDSLRHSHIPNAENECSRTEHGGNDDE